MQQFKNTNQTFNHSGLGMHRIFTLLFNNNPARRPAQVLVSAEASPGP